MTAKVYRLCRLLNRPGEGEPAVPDTDPYRVPRREVAPQDVLRQRILDLLLDGPFQRPCTIDWVEPRLPEQVAGRLIQNDVQITVLQALAQVGQLDVHDLADLLGAERMEHDDVIDPVDEL